MSSSHFKAESGKLEFVYVQCYLLSYISPLGLIMKYFSLISFFILNCFHYTYSRFIFYIQWLRYKYFWNQNFSTKETKSLFRKTSLNVIKYKIKKSIVACSWANCPLFNGILNRLWSYPVAVLFPRTIAVVFNCVYSRVTESHTIQKCLNYCEPLSF